MKIDKDLKTNFYSTFGKLKDESYNDKDRTLEVLFFTQTAVQKERARIKDVIWSKLEPQEAARLVKQITIKDTKETK